MDLTPIIRDITPGAVGIWLIVLIYGGKTFVDMFREWRLNRKLSLDDRLAKQSGYEKRTNDLEEENRALRKEIIDIRREHEAYRDLCHGENDQLRAQLRRLWDRFFGLKRAMEAGHMAAFDVIPPELRPAASEAAAKRIREIFREEDAREPDSRLGHRELPE